MVYLDSDVGQPEFTPPGFLSLTLVDKLTPGNFVMFLCSVDKFLCTEFNNKFLNDSLYSLLTEVIFFFFLKLDLSTPCLKTPER